MVFFRVGGQPWQPTPNSKICSLHFQGGAKSNNPLSEAFNPTILPSVYKNKSRLTTSKRAERLQARQANMERWIYLS